MESFVHRTGEQLEAHWAQTKKMQDALDLSKTIYKCCSPHCSQIQQWQKQKQCYQQCAQNYLKLRSQTYSTLNDMTQ